MLKYFPVEYHDISPQFVSEFFALVDSASRIVITGHEFPDDDSIASILSIYTLISTRDPQKDLRMYCLGREDKHLSCFKNYDRIEFYKEIADHLKGTDLLIVLDGGKFARFSHKPEILKAVPLTICLDHHSSPIDQFTLSLVIPEAPACSQIICRTFFNPSKIDSDLAKIFLLGILGDTGNLSYLKPSQSETITIVKNLIDISQLNILEFQTSYRSVSRRVFSAIKEFVKNTKFISQEPNWPSFQYSFVTRNFVTRHHYSDNEITEAGFLYVYRYLRTISGYTWGFVISPRADGDATISCRSLPGSVNVKDLLENMGIGGGHDDSAGGKFTHQKKSLDAPECLKTVLLWMHLHSPNSN